MKIKLLVAKGLDESMCDNMHVYLEQQPRALLRKVAFYDDTLSKILEKNVRTNESPRDGVFHSAVKPSKLYAHAAMLSDDNDQKFTTDIPTMTLDRSYDDRRQYSFPSSSSNLLYSPLCLKMTHSFLRFPYMPRPSDFLKKRKTFWEF